MVYLLSWYFTYSILTISIRISEWISILREYHCISSVFHSLAPCPAAECGQRLSACPRTSGLGPARFSNICEPSIHGSPENRDIKSILDSWTDSFIDKIPSFWRIVDSRFTWKSRKSGFWIEGQNRVATSLFFSGIVNSQLFFRAESTPELILLTTPFCDSFYY